MRKERFDAIETKLVELARQAGAKDVTVGEIIGKFFPRAFVWARRGESKIIKMGEDKAQNVITFEVIFETMSGASSASYDQAKTLYYNFYDLLLADVTLGGLCLRALPIGFERREFQAEGQWGHVWVTYVEVLIDI